VIGHYSTVGLAEACVKEQVELFQYSSHAIEILVRPLDFLLLPQNS